MDSLIAKIKEYVAQNPQIFGLLFIAFGVFMLIGSIRGWKWIFHDVSGSTYSLAKLDGWVNMFGVKTARIVAGIGSVITIIAGIVWFWIYAYYL